VQQGLGFWTCLGSHNLCRSPKPLLGARLGHDAALTNIQSSMFMLNQDIFSCVVVVFYDLGVNVGLCQFA